jgi:hypothetical protein
MSGSVSDATVEDVELALDDPREKIEPAADDMELLAEANAPFVVTDTASRAWSLANKLLRGDGPKKAAASNEVSDAHRSG